MHKISPAPPQGCSSILHMERVTRHFQKRIVVEDFSLELAERGEIVGLLGPNGAGKTTVLRMLLGMLTPSSGSVELFGIPMTDASRRGEALQRVGALIETPTFYPYLSGKDNLRIVSLLSGVPETTMLKRHIAQALERVDLATEGSLIFKKYSLGMKQRLGIAAALLTQPELLVLDEPTNGLDPIGMIHLRELLLALAEQGTTILLSSHLLHEVQQICNRVSILKKGHVAIQGQVSKLLQGRGLIEVVYETLETLEAAEALLKSVASQGEGWLRQIDRLTDERGGGSRSYVLQVHAPVTSSTELCALLARHELYPAEIRRREMSLEQFFLDQAYEPTLSLSRI